MHDASTTDDGCRHLNEALERIRELTEQRDAAREVLQMFLDCRNEDDDYVARDEARSVLGGVGEGEPDA
jgi:hypothetical protein